MSGLGFFNAGNASIGAGLSGPGEFPDAPSLIAHLDYLGIERSLVWNKEALDINAAAGNAGLLTALAGNDEFSKRLVPAFVVSPTLIYEREGLPWLLDGLKKGVRALMIFPGSGRFEIRTLEPLLEKTARYSPSVFWDLRDGGSFSEFAELALKFPDTHFVVSSFMWGQLNNVLDMMSRADNILAEISWHHVTDGIETLVSNFGAERVLFGFGFKSHYGASMSAVTFAKISGADKQKIAGKNLESILGLKPFKGVITPPEIISRKPLWAAFREGKKLSGTEIIDAHGHSGPGGARCWNFLGSSCVPELYIKRLTDSMENLGVSRMMISHLPSLFGDSLSKNREIEDFAAKHGKGMLSGWLGFNPAFKEALIPEFDKFFSRGFFKGFKLLCDYWRVPVTDKCFEPVWKYAHKHKMPILLHTWDGPYDSPGMLADIAPKYPGAAFLLGHSGGGTGGRLQAIELGEKNKNVYFEFCGSFTTPLDFSDIIRKFGPGRVIFGSDLDGHNQAWELGRFLSLPFPDDELRPGLAGNIKRLLSNIKP
jgi:predicted TIM-barrel fold metal-dependent hydrolase